MIDFGVENKGPNEESEFVLDPSQFYFFSIASMSSHNAEVEIGGDGGIDLPDFELTDVIAVVEGGHGGGSE